jgi:gliding motility-associated-like protein
MKLKPRFVLFIAVILNITMLYSQRGKDGDYTVTALNTNVNSFTYLTADAASGATVITVNSTAMSGGAFSSNLAQGDLILIIQMQGATMDIDATPTVSWGGNYTVPNSWITGSTAWNTQPWLWGQVTNYNNCGKYEQVEVRSVSGANITLNCALQNSYTSSGHVQVVRVPRFNNLTLNSSTSILPTAWNGNSGGIAAIEVNGNLTFNSSSKISASGAGFRGGSTTSPTTQVGSPGTCSAHTNGTGNGSTQVGSSASTEGGRKGEGIGGYTTEYTAQYSGYGRGAPANGGGGGGYQNCGGGGGSNVGSGLYTGKGVPSTTVANSVWDLETAGLGGSSSSGGGRGGYALSNSDKNATTVGPNNTNWCASSSSSDARKENGGFGGHPLTYNANRLFFGGGGGAGDQDQAQGGSGGAGGGLVFLTVYGTVSGTGTIEADGANGGNTVGGTAGIGQLKGNDGAGGAGGGGAIFIRNSNPLPSTLTLNAKGGNGGNQNLVVGSFASVEAAGPGGAGSGGSIAFSSGSPSQNVAGGTAGTTNSAHLTEFTFNGATNGASGLSSLSATVYNLTANNTSVCAGSTVTFSVSVTGIPPGTVNWYSAQYGGSSLATGNSYTPAVAPTTTTTYYAGICPGTFRVPVTVTINSLPIISGTPVLTNPTCSGAGSITGLNVSSGTTPYLYSWSGTTTSSADYTNIPAGTYTLTVTDAAGCTATNGPHTLTGTSGPIIDATAISIQNVTCTGGLGSITGITATGTGLSYAWDNSGGSSLNATGLSAGSYTLTVTDNNSCTSTSGPYTVGTDTGPAIDESLASVTDATCGQSNGGVSGITASGSSLNYSWSGSSSTSLDLSGVASGTYTLTVTDAGGCTISSSPYLVSDLAGPTIDITAVSIFDQSCGLADGSISGVIVSGGTAGYNYTWSGNSQTTIDITGLSAGTYTLTATDANGCTATSSSLTVGTASGPVLDETNVIVADVQCDGTLGSITGITATGTALSFSWSNGGDNTINASSLLPNSYVLTATDASGCTATSSAYTVSAATPLVINTGGMTVTPSSCTSNTGAISGIVIVGGVNPVPSWSSSQGTLDISGLAAGTYILTVTDDQGCSASETVNVSTAGGPSISLVSSSDITCNGLNDGTATVSGTGGTGSLTYLWTPGSLSGTSQTGLLGGIYTVTVTDGGGCSNSLQVTINEPSALTLTQGTITPANCGANDGGASVTANGGTGTLSYSWSPTGGNAAVASNIAGGTYTITATDQNSCTASVSLVVNTLGGPTVSVSGQTNVTCHGGADGTITVNASGGTGSLTYAWTPSGGNAPTATGLSAGTYTVSVTDGAGCIGSAIATVTEPVMLSVNTNVTAADCGSSNGAISISVNGGTAPYSYAWSPSVGSGATVSGLTPGSYSVTVMDASGCTISETSSIVVLGTLTVEISPASAVLDQGQSVMLSASGATSYSWSPATDLSCADCSSPLASPTQTTTYTVTGSDASGCTGTASVTILVNEDCNEIYVPTVFSPDGVSGNPENQKICIYGNCIVRMTYMVFDRWGNKVYEYSPEIPCWDGTFNGQKLNAGVYAYKLYVMLTNGEYVEESGNVTLIR